MATNPESHRTARTRAPYSPGKGQPLLGLVLAVLSGVLLFLSFPPFALGWLAWVAFVPALYAQETWCGLAGLAFFLIKAGKWHSAV